MYLLQCQLSTFKLWIKFGVCHHAKSVIWANSSITIEIHFDQ